MALSYARLGFYIVLFSFITLQSIDSKFAPTWDSLDKRPLPQWFDDSKVGILICWGVYSVPAWGGWGAEWFWWWWKGANQTKYIDYMSQTYPPGVTFQDLAASWRAQLYDPNEWADIFKAAGAKYVVLTSKHHEGFTLWPSKVSWNWNAMDVGPKRDLLGDLAVAIRNRTDIHFGLYHSLFEWFNPIYLKDKANKFTTQDFVKTKTGPELYELVNKYQPELIWSDGEWEAEDTYWNSTNFIAWLYNDSPVKNKVVVNDRWGSRTLCKHGDYYTCQDRYNPGKLQNHKWENAMTIDKLSWGYRRNAPLSDYLTMVELTTTIAETISCGGNILVNIGPTADGRIPPIFEERLRQMGQWLKVNGEAIYGSKPWAFQNDTATHGVWYTYQKATDSVYAIVTGGKMPFGKLMLGAPNPSPGTQVTLLGYTGGPFRFDRNPPGGIAIDVPAIPASQMPCDWAWTFKFTQLAN
ncbi:alpha-L-fucosidase-like isoform X1 [Lingula anatina]|uniref:alpha-L-fucosidase n=1 Tax=Lingula anatina TaxID=7574 RepID=A0A1S3KHU5_LINAN|nr:alpha-L-fucosidase-like isoform X1 [Lingula anatina]|eukprot:XP_013422200.1 alpha-L-fucosidase-like isoform X1 [Lingula anatina]